MVSVASNPYRLDLLHIVWLNSVAGSVCSLNLAVLVVRVLHIPTFFNFTWLKDLHVSYVNVRIPYFKKKNKKKGDNNIWVMGWRKIENFNLSCSEWCNLFRILQDNSDKYDIKFNHFIHSFFFTLHSLS